VTGLIRLGLGWGLDKMMMLAKLSVLDFGKEKILGDNDVEDVELDASSLVLQSRFIMTT
jgi:hypothetical protein